MGERARAIMFQGTGSSVGKSLLVAGLGRALVRRGLRVRPFKPQNMSNNAAATADGGEIGRAQALQARACGVPPSRHMNPVLLKPQSEIGAQIIRQGQRWATADARAYQALKPQLMPAVLESFAIMGSQADIILVEGAGSAAETNLRAHDIANMGFAAATGVPVVMIGDIDRGGVIASLVGTATVLDPADAARIKGFIINKMRGDPRLFDEGMVTISARTGWPALGLVPYFIGADQLPAEDAADLGDRYASETRATDGRIRVAVPILPRIANFDDLDPLAAEPGIELITVRPGQPLPVATVVLLPGSKATIADLAAFRAAGWEIDLQAHRRRGGRIWGLCGGYQMLGRRIADPEGHEGPAGSVVPGLGLLDVETVLTGDKRVAPVAGVLAHDHSPVRGYEIHLGRTHGPDTGRPLVTLADGRPDGAQSADGRVVGTYLHGLFTADRARARLIEGWGASAAGIGYEDGIEAILDRLADHLEAHVAIDRLLALAG